MSVTGGTAVSVPHNSLIPAFKALQLLAKGSGYEHGQRNYARCHRIYGRCDVHAEFRDGPLWHASRKRRRLWRNHLFDTKIIHWVMSPTVIGVRNVEQQGTFTDPSCSRDRGDLRWMTIVLLLALQALIAALGRRLSAIKITWDGTILWYWYRLPSAKRVNGDDGP